MRVVDGHLRRSIALTSSNRLIFKSVLGSHFFPNTHEARPSLGRKSWTKSIRNESSKVTQIPFSAQIVSKIVKFQLCLRMSSSHVSFFFKQRLKTSMREDFNWVPETKPGLGQHDTSIRNIGVIDFQQAATANVGADSVDQE